MRTALKSQKVLLSSPLTLPALVVLTPLATGTVLVSAVNATSFIFFNLRPAVAQGVLDSVVSRHLLKGDCDESSEK